ncbi:MAG: hypothetical protein Q9218_002937 [Villophora microphyllina]
MEDSQEQAAQRQRSASPNRSPDRSRRSNRATPTSTRPRRWPTVLDWDQATKNNWEHKWAHKISELDFFDKMCTTLLEGREERDKKIKELERKCDKASQRVHRRDQRLEAAQEKISGMEVGLLERDQLAIEGLHGKTASDAMHKRFVENAGEIEALNEELREEREKGSADKAQNHRLLAENDTLKEHNERLKADNDKLRSDYDSLEHANSLNLRTIAAQKKTVGHNITSISNHQTTIDTLRADNDRLQTANATLGANAALQVANPASQRGGRQRRQPKPRQPRAPRIRGNTSPPTVTKRLPRACKDPNKNYKSRTLHRAAVDAAAATKHRSRSNSPRRDPRPNRERNDSPPRPPARPPRLNWRQQRADEEEAERRRRSAERAARDDPVESDEAAGEDSSEPEEETTSEESPESDEDLQRFGPDRTPGSTETDHPRPGCGPLLPPDAGVLETNPALVRPTIEIGRDPVLALQAQRASYQVDERRFRHQLGERDDRIAFLERQVDEQRTLARGWTEAYRNLDRVHERLSGEYNDLQRRYDDLQRYSQARVQQQQARIQEEQVWGNRLGVGLENQRARIQDLDAEAQTLANDLQFEREQVLQQNNQIRALNARIRGLEARGEGRDEQAGQTATRRRGTEALRANNMPPHVANSARVLNAPQQINAPQQANVPPPVNAPPQQPRQRRPQRPQQPQRPTPSPQARRLPRACKGKVRSYKQPR